MGIFTGSSTHVSEVSAKQVQLECGSILLEGEYIEKAIKVAIDKIICTNRRLLLVLAQKDSKVEYLSLPYNHIRKFSIISKALSASTVDLFIWMRDEQKPIKKVLRDYSGISDLYRILGKYIMKTDSALIESL